MSVELLGLKVTKACHHARWAMDVSTELVRQSIVGVKP